MKLSVVIPTYERPNEILRLTSGLLDQTLSLKIIIVDTSKSINEILSKAKNPNFKYIYLPDNL